MQPPADTPFGHTAPNMRISQSNASYHEPVRQCAQNIYTLRRRFSCVHGLNNVLAKIDGVYANAGVHTGHIQTWQRMPTTLQITIDALGSEGGRAVTAPVAC